MSINFIKSNHRVIGEKMKKIVLLILSITFAFSISTKKIYNVEGMFCGYGCVDNIKSSLKKLEGVEEFSIDFETKRMEVLFDDANLKSEVLVNSLSKPYKATLIKQTISKEYMVEGITCFGCVNQIQNSIDQLEGLENYELQFEESLLFIEFNIEKTDAKSIISKIPSKFKVVEVSSVEAEEPSKE